MPASQIKVPAQIKGGMGLNPGGTSSQFLDGTGVPKDLSASDISNAIPGLTTGAGGSSGQSYGNPGGSGPRTSMITVSSGGGLLGSGSGAFSALVNGNNSIEQTQWFANALSLSGSVYLRFDFGSARIITEAKYYQSTTNSHGTWKWQGSNDASAWTDIGSSFTLGGATTNTLSQLSGNTVAYRHYQIVGVSGTTSPAPYIYEFEFKIDDNSAVSASTFSAPGNACFTGQVYFGSVAPFFSVIPQFPAVASGQVLAASLNGIPAFRALVANDMPAVLNATTFSGMDITSYIRVRGSATSIPTGAAWTTVLGGIPTNTIVLLTVDTKGFIYVWWDGTTLTKASGNSSDLVVASSAGATEFAFRVSGGNLQISNGTGTTRTAKLCEWIGA